jgi:hypothetical protein
MRVRAVQKIYYGRRDRHPGDTYDMDDREESEAKILAAIGKIEILGPEAKKPAPAVEYRTAALEPEPAPAAAEAKPMTTTEDDEALTSGTKRYYRRRDMRAEK